eukprot:3833834-Prymnesium_polylepis.1
MPVIPSGSISRRSCLTPSERCWTRRYSGAPVPVKARLGAESYAAIQRVGPRRPATLPRNSCRARCCKGGQPTRSFDARGTPAVNGPALAGGRHHHANHHVHKLSGLRVHCQRRAGLHRNGHVRGLSQSEGTDRIFEHDLLHPLLRAVDHVCDAPRS